MKHEPGKLKLGYIVNGHGTLDMNADMRAQHLYVVGATGTGKSKFLEHLIRQDILSQRYTNSGLLLLDPHGSLYDDIMRWLAWNRIDRPIIPIDLRRDDWIVAYNLLRKRNTASTVVVDNIVSAIAHVWGSGGLSQTPLFARWASAIMQVLYEKGLTLVEAQFLTNRLEIEIRKSLANGTENPIVKDDWDYANTIRPKDFEDEIGSSINRIRRFISNESLRCIFGQAEVSLDLGTAIKEGQIILVCLATHGGKISSEDANLFGTLLLTDLWTAAKEQVGKRNQKDVKPFYVYLDEFQKLVTPTIAEGLDEARGFGLHLTMANQYPSQLLETVDERIGRKLYNSVMNNARSKVVFCIETMKELEPLAEWLYMATINPDEIKHVLHSTKVINYKIEYMTAYSHGTSKTEGGARSYSETSGSGSAGAKSTSRGESFNPEDEERGYNITENDMNSWNEYFANTISNSSNWSEGEQYSETTSPMLIPIMGKEMSSIQFRSVEEQIFRSMAVLFDQKRKQAVVRLYGSKIPVSVFTPNVEDVPATKERADKYAIKLLEKLPFALKKEDALKKLEDRSRQIRLEINPQMKDFFSTPVKNDTIPSQAPIMIENKTIKSIILPGMKFTERDAQILREIYECRMMTIEQVGKLFFDGSYEAAKKRMSKLEAARLLKAVETDDAKRVYAQKIYTVTNLCYDILFPEAENPQRESWNVVRKRFDIRGSTIKHEMGVVNIKAELEPALNKVSGLKVHEFGTMPLHYEFNVILNGKETTKRPDGYLKFARYNHDDPPEYQHFFIEYDRTSEDHATLIEKIEGYKYYLRKSGFRNWLSKSGFSGNKENEYSFRVLIILISEERKNNLCEKLININVESIVWLTTYDEIITTPLGEIWTIPKFYKEGIKRKFTILDDPGKLV